MEPGQSPCVQSFTHASMPPDIEMGADESWTDLTKCGRKPAMV